MSRTKQKKKNKILKTLKIILLILVILLIACIIYVYSFIKGKFNNINYKELDNTDLGLNENLYSLVSDKMSKSEFAKIKNVLVVASDSENGYDKEAHADVIMLFSVNPNKNSVKLISIPRDTAVDIPEYKRYKLNYSYTLGQEQLLIKMINTTFGLNIDEYVTIDFDGLIHVINSIGGIELNITEEEKNYINNTSGQAYKVSGNRVRYLYDTGKVNLSGEQALTHARNRSVGNDLIRTERHRDIIQAMMTKISGMGYDAITALSNKFLQEVTTNVNINEYMTMLPGFLINAKTYINNVTSTMVPSMDYSQGKTVNGGYVIETDVEKAKAEFIKYMYEM